MQANRVGEIEAWKLSAIRSCALRWGFRGHDLADVCQALVVVVAKFQFDPTKANGATEETATRAVIDHHLWKVCRKKKRYERRIKKYGGFTDVRNREDLVDPERHDLSIDRNEALRKAMSEFCDVKKAICSALSDGKSEYETSHILGLSRREVAMHLLEIKSRLIGCGLGIEGGVHE